MSKELGTRLPAAFQQAFSDRELRRHSGKGYVVVTIDADGTPRLSMLSAGEIVAVDDRRFRLGLWPGSSTGKNVGAGRPIALCYVAPNRVLYVHGRGRRLGGDEAVETFEVAVDHVRSDQHEGLPVRDTFTFDCVGMSEDDMLRMWSDQRALVHDARDSDA